MLRMYWFKAEMCSRQQVRLWQPVVAKRKQNVDPSLVSSEREKIGSMIFWFRWCKFQYMGGSGGPKPMIPTPTNSDSLAPTKTHGLLGRSLCHHMTTLGAKYGWYWLKSLKMRGITVSQPSNFYASMKIMIWRTMNFNYGCFIADRIGSQGSRVTLPAPVSRKTNPWVSPCPKCSYANFIAGSLKLYLNRLDPSKWKRLPATVGANGSYPPMAVKYLKRTRKGVCQGSTCWVCSLMQGSSWVLHTVTTLGKTYPVSWDKIPACNCFRVNSNQFRNPTAVADELVRSVGRGGSAAPCRSNAMAMAIKLPSMQRVDIGFKMQKEVWHIHTHHTPQRMPRN